MQSGGRLIDSHADAKCTSHVLEATVDEGNLALPYLHSPIVTILWESHVAQDPKWARFLASKVGFL